MNARIREREKPLDDEPAFSDEEPFVLERRRIADHPIWGERRVPRVHHAPYHFGTKDGD